MKHAILSSIEKVERRTQIRAADIPHALDDFGDEIKLLSLDCFDTLLWRNIAAPKDVFSVIAQSETAKNLGVTPDQRNSASAHAYRRTLNKGLRLFHISDVYDGFAALTESEKASLVEAEIQAEMSVCFAFQPCIELIRKAHSRGIKIMIVSDIYYREAEMRRLLGRHLPKDVTDMIDRIYCSCDAGTSKSDALFPYVLERCGVPAHEILHIGDHAVYDFEAPRRYGIHALHFVQFDPKTLDVLRMQNAASSLVMLAQAMPKALLAPRYSPFRPVFSAAQLHPYKPETIIGYMSFGPVLFGYAHFLANEVQALRQQGKRVKVFFLLRDAYLLGRACEAYAGEPVGHYLRIRKDMAVQSSFRTRADVDYYIGSIKPEHFDFQVVVYQLMLPRDLAAFIIQSAGASPDPHAAFLKLIFQDEVLEITFKESALVRERLRRYFLKYVQPQEGDVVVLADYGFLGITQDFLARTFQDEFKIEIVGRYVVSSRDPSRPGGKSLITTGWCDHTLLEQSSTLREGMVVGYTEEGEPILENPKLSDEQYEKAAAIQAECIRFIEDAKKYFDGSKATLDPAILREAAHSALFRHIYMPGQEELDYFQCFQHDKDMGRDLKKKVYNVDHARRRIKTQRSPYRFDSYETRALSLDLTLSALTQRGLQLDFTPEDMNIRFAEVKVVSMKGQTPTHQIMRAAYLHDGYFLLSLPCSEGESLGIMFGETYEWVQIEKVEFLNSAEGVLRDMKACLVCDEIGQHGPLYECLSRNGLMIIKPVVAGPPYPHSCNVVFRPLVERKAGVG